MKPKQAINAPFCDKRQKLSIMRRQFVENDFDNCFEKISLQGNFRGHAFLEQILEFNSPA